MVELKQETYFTMREHAWPGETELGLNEIATQYFGRTYNAQQTGEMMANDTYHAYHCEEGREEWWELDDDHWQYGVLNDWLAENPDDYKYDFQLYRKAPTPDFVVPYLVMKGVLPKGKYLIFVSW